VTSAIDGKMILLHVLPWRSSSGVTPLDGVGNTEGQLNYSRAYDTIGGVWGFVTFVSTWIYDVDQNYEWSSHLRVLWNELELPNFPLL